MQSSAEVARTNKVWLGSAITRSDRLWLWNGGWCFELDTLDISYSLSEQNYIRFFLYMLISGEEKNVISEIPIV